MNEQPVGCVELKELIYEKYILEVIAGLIKDGRYMISYLPDGVYADLRTVSNMRFKLQADLKRIQNRISRWLRIFFLECKDVYGKPDAISGMMILK